MPEPTADLVEAFLARWSASGGNERANYQLFLAELCDLLGVPRPDPARPENAANAYVFERSVTRAKPDGTATTNYLDLYRCEGGGIRGALSNQGYSLARRGLRNGRLFRTWTLSTRFRKVWK